MVRSLLEWRALNPLVALGLFGIGALLIALGNYSDYGPEEPLWLRMVPMALVCTGVVLRQRAPLTGLGLGTVGVILDLAFGVTLPTVVVYTDNLYAAVLYGPRKGMKVLPVLAAAFAAVPATGVALLGGDLSDILITLAVWMGVVVSPIATAIILRQARERAELEAERAEQTARLADVRRREAVLRERTTMARELHDTVANYLSAIALQSTGLQARPDLDEDAMARSIAAIRQSSVDGLAELRRIIGILRSGDSDEELSAHRLDQLPELIDRMRGVGLKVDFTAEGARAALPGQVEAAAFRVVQEALTNALKYGSNAAVSVVHEPDRLVVAVENEIDPAAEPVPSGGAGLIGMTERVRLLGGTVRAGPDGRRWRVRADIPTGGNGDQGSAR